MSGTRFVPLAAPVDVRATLAPLARGPYDPCVQRGRHEIWRATHTPDGPGSQHVVAVADGVEVEAFGPGAAWLLEHAPALVGAADTGHEFAPADALVAELHRRDRGLRLAAAGNPVELMVPTVLEQKVTSTEAHRAYSRLVRAHGHPAPGPNEELRLPPTVAELAVLPSYAWHAVGVERRRADTIREVCTRAGAIERVAAEGSVAFQQRVTALPGIGPWTATSVAGLAFGDPDAVVVGDYHLPSIVAWNLVGERRADDARPAAPCATSATSEAAMEPGPREGHHYDAPSCRPSRSSAPRGPSPRRHSSRRTISRRVSASRSSACRT